MRAPGGRSTARRPSHHTTPEPSVRGSTSTASRECGPTTSGRANRACALIGTTQQRLDVGPDHRAAGGEGVGRRARGRRHDDAVAAPGRQRPAVDLDGQLEHPLARRLLDGHLVERPRREHRVPVLAGAHLEGHPLLDGVVPRDDPFDGGVEVLALGLGQEADVTEVDPEQRHPDPRDSSAPRRIVPSPPSTQTARSPWPPSGVGVGSWRPRHRPPRPGACRRARRPARTPRHRRR